MLRVTFCKHVLAQLGCQVRGCLRPTLIVQPLECAQQQRKHGFSLSMPVPMLSDVGLCRTAKD
jgi:hypothetical protein